MNLNDMQLPLVNTNEDLETLSENKLKLLFDANKFEIRPELNRDKGIDLSIEIKKGGRYLNFRAVVQLKATESINPNKDGSYSLQMDCSNLNYLLNSGLPAFYIFYVKQTDTFYFEEVSVFARSLEEKNSDWRNQSTHTLRFNKVLTVSMVDSLFEIILKRGQFQRTVTEAMIQRNASFSDTDKILIDVDLNVTSDSEIRNIIEEYGIMLDNEGKWSDIINLHKKGSGSIAVTAKYNFYLGIAYYHTGNLSEAISFFKAAGRLKSQLSDLLQNHLQFFDITARYSIGILTEEEYLAKMSELEDHPSIGLYIKLSKAKKTYLEADKISSQERFDNFYLELQDIINNDNATLSIKLEARCEIMLYEGYRNNIFYIQSASGLNVLDEPSIADLDARIAFAQSFTIQFMNWYNKLQILRKEAFDTRNYFTHFHAVLNEVKISYEFCVYRSVIAEIRESQGLPREEMYDQEEVFGPLLKMLDESFEYYNKIGHVLNTAATLAQKYEVMHFLKRLDDAGVIMETLESLVGNYDLFELTNRLNYLKTEGPTHIIFEKWLIKMFEDKKVYSEQSKIQADEIGEMDKQDFKERKIDNTYFQIELFPIGQFQFPNNEINKVYQILNINSNDLKEQFENMFVRNIVPIANVYNNPIMEEGHLRGFYENKSIDCWSNLFRVRKAFFENKFYKIR